MTPEEAAVQIARELAAAAPIDRFLLGLPRPGVASVVGIAKSEAAVKTLADAGCRVVELGDAAIGIGGVDDAAFDRMTARRDALSRVGDALTNVVAISKSDVKEERFVLGIVMIPDPTGGDKQGHTYSAEEVRKACYSFMERGHHNKVQHEDAVTLDQVIVLENYLAPCDCVINGKAIKEGTWMLAVRVLDDALWAKIKAGEMTGFSIGGDAIVIKLRPAA